MRKIAFVLAIGSLFMGLSNLYAEEAKLTVKGETHLATQAGTKVGIGTTDPQTTLDVHNGTLKVSGGSSFSQDTARFVVDTGGSTEHVPMELRNDDGVLFRVRGDGKVGIGTAYPTVSKLQIEGDGLYGGVLRLINTGTNGARVFFAATSDDWNTMGAKKLGIGFGNPPVAEVGSGLVKLTIQEDGNVGIGTLNPQSTAPNEIAEGNLDVNDVYVRANGAWISQMAGPTTGTYKGGGGSTKTTLGYRPTYVTVIYGGTGSVISAVKMGSMPDKKAFMEYKLAETPEIVGFRDCMEFTDDGFKVFDFANLSGGTYHYTAWP